ncbi:MAG: 1-acyl-sn-glycerol-3-phosphate acyltransferase [Clostridia bacterium]|nr:1-acyl-sn-glycerol-3-phosphate acyltransferase [Clostridia bacterium]
MSKNKKKKQKIGKPNAFIYTMAYLAMKRKYTKKYGISYDREIVKNIKGPAIIVATHTSDMDHYLSALTLYPIRPTYIVSEHFMHNPSTAGLLKLMHVIPKKMFTPDASTIVKILRAKHEGAVIVIFAEGRLSCYGHTLPIADGTAELIKKLGVDLYAWKAEGAYLTFPKWRDKGDDRPGKIHASVKLLLTADEIAEKDVCEIQRITADAISNDDEMAMDGIEYRSENIARGVDKILFKCPICKKEGTVKEDSGHIKCECGLDATLDSQYRLHGSPFTRVNEWFEWQQSSIDTETESISSKARLGCCGDDGFMDANAGEGEIYIDKDVFRLKGTMHGEEIEFEVSPEKIVAFPITPGDHFDIYHNGRLIYVSPQPNPNMTVKWVCFLDKLMEERRKAKK